jgi:hypothetical protein
METKESPGAEKGASTELTVLLDLTKTEKDLAVFEETHRNVVYDVTVPAEMKKAKQVRAEAKTMRTTVEKKRLEAGRILLDMKKTNDDKAKALIERISLIEEPLDSAIKTEEARVEAERAAAAAKEQERVDRHEANIQRLRDFPLSLQGKPSSVIESRIEAFIREHFDTIENEHYEEFSQRAKDAYFAALHSARIVCDQAKADEAERERVRKQDEENARLREQVAQMEREREEARQREEARRLEDEKREQARIDSIKDRIAHIRTFGFTADYEMRSHAELVASLERLDKEDPSVDGGFDFQEFKDEAKQAWMDSHAALMHAIASAQEREEEARADQQRRHDEDLRLAQQREEQRREKERLDRERAEHEAQVERDRIAKIGLMEAVKAVVDDFREDYPIPESIQDLIKVYDALPVEKKQAAKPVKKAVQ